MNDKIITIKEITKAEDNLGKSYLKITDSEGTTRNIKEGRNKLLTTKRELLKVGATIKLHFQDYKTESGKIFPFVNDFELVPEGEPQAQAPSLVQAQFQSQARTANTNLSIECQVLAKIVSELWQAGKLTDNDKEVLGLRNWICEHLPTPIPTAPIIEKDKPNLLIAATEMGAIPEFKSKGEFLTQVIKAYKGKGLTTKAKVEEVLGRKIEELTDMASAWAFLYNFLGK